MRGVIATSFAATSRLFGPILACTAWVGACRRPAPEARITQPPPTASNAPAAPKVIRDSDVAAGAHELPRQLACLARIYERKVVRDAGADFLELADGTRLPFDGGEAKTFEERLDHPVLKDMFVAPYPAGPIVPILAPNGDPGRVRVTALFADVYGASADVVARRLVRVDVLGHAFMVHRRVAPALARVARRLASSPDAGRSYGAFFVRPGGTFVFRNIAGTDRRSMHAFGAALDLDTRHGAVHRWDKSHLWRNALPDSLIHAFEAEGFIWGGRWYEYDTIHFEYRPELTDPSCSP